MFARPSVHSSHPLLPFTVLVFLLATLCNSTLASETEDLDFTEQDFYLDLPVVLSATRLSQPEKNAPASVTVLDREIIQASGAVDLYELFSLIPGFQVGSINANVHAVTYHGLSYEFPRKFQVMIDNRTVYRPLLSSVDWESLSIAIADIQRIEVIRGPNIPAYGSNAIAGVINIVTEHPGEQPGAHYNLVGGYANRKNADLRYASSALGMDYRLTLGHRQDNGFDNVNDSKNVDYSSLRGIKPLDDRNTLELNFGYNQGALGAFVDTTAVDPERTLHVDSYHAYSRWTHIPEPGNEFYVQFFYNFYDGKDRYKIGPLSSLLDVPPEEVPTLLNGQPDQLIDGGHYDGRSDRLDLEFQHTWQIYNNSRLVWGGGARRDRIKGKIILDHDDYERNNSLRLFANWEWFYDNDLVFNLGLMSENQEVDKPRTSPRAALNYHIAKNQTLRASATRAYRIPSLFEVKHRWVHRFNDGELLQIQYERAKDLEPEEINAYELGYLAGFYDNRLTFDIKLFREEINNLISAPKFPIPEPYVNDGARIWFNSGYATLVGYELETEFKTDNLYASLRYAYTDSEGQITTIMFPFEKDDFVDNVPTHTYSGLLSYKFNTGTQISAVYFRRSYLEWSGSATAYEPFDRWDINLAQQIGRPETQTRLSLIVKNALNDEYSDLVLRNIYERRIYLQFSSRVP